MFRVLSNEESHQVKKWRAPSLRESAEQLNPLVSRAGQTLDSDDSATTDIAHLRHAVRDTHDNSDESNDDMSAAQGQANGASSMHASLAMSTPSADMLQQTYDEGYAAGVQKCQSQFDSSANDTLTSLLGSLAPKKYEIDAKIENEVVSLAKAMAKMLLRREVETEDSVILDVVKTALAQMPMTTEPLKVLLHPTDLSIVQSMQTPPVQATLVPDTDMKRGDCRIESGASMLDGGLDALVESISSCSEQATSGSAGVKHTNSEASAKAGESL